MSYVAYLLFIVGGVFLVGLPLPLPYNVLFFVVFAVVLVIVGVYAMTTTVVDPADSFRITNVNFANRWMICSWRRGTTAMCAGSA